MRRFQVGEMRYMLSEQTAMLMRLWLGLCLVGIIAFFQVDVFDLWGNGFLPYQHLVSASTMHTRWSAKALTAYSVPP